MSHAGADSKTPVSVITGFLGSGKATLLDALLEQLRIPRPSGVDPSSGDARWSLTQSLSRSV